ncbi:hypothetical protein HHK36_017981 [Tetracentron sinense]|uniref:Charged multivesicular body protein 5 n=1 Tax=Tetracentron sinense TaxID=13715 RepID=A0A835DDK5_TETSI|nr:hypothetical protein HHK36_017981 [Tetracentron sinense]
MYVHSTKLLVRYEGQRDMLYNQTFNLDQVAFAAEGIKDAQQTMSALKSANKELKGMMKTVKIQDIDNMQDEMMDLMDVSTEIQESLGRSYSVPDDIDEEELMGEIDALEADMGMETESDGVPTYLQPDKESDLDAELNLPSAPSGHAAVPPSRHNQQSRLRELYLLDICGLLAMALLMTAKPWLKMNWVYLLFLERPFVVKELTEQAINHIVQDLSSHSVDRLFLLL